MGWWFWPWSSKQKCFDDVAAMSKNGECMTLLIAMISSFDTNEEMVLEENNKFEEEEDNVLMIL